MATDDFTLSEEVRVQTGLTDESALSDEDLLTLIGRAKFEIEDEVRQSVTDFYATSDLEGALFWLSCIFAVGEGAGGGDAFSLGSIEYRPGNGDAYPQSWDDRYRRYIAGVIGAQRNFVGSTSVARDDRSYEYTYTPLDDI
ncbi:hypothetical protein [Halobellus limi]|uniref:Uncharacterized protein n=1 Tax=Halobellus limi TaxID=699433 RepID=A0A1H5ZHF3_9EURY|nr:hypothetical protein [Halobellus limi]QCC48090.1 hypothetical protein DV707_10700 [Halobellus limi]SEG35889.1 hypothetical protein SAMN04488133_2005 [Halobellus limi]